jgi:hypothetical protein
MRTWAVLLLAIVLPSIATSARSEPLMVVTRDGTLHRLSDGGTEQKTALGLEAPRAAAGLGTARVAIAHKKGLTIVDGAKKRAVPGKQDDLLRLAGLGERLYGATSTGELVEIDVASGKRKSLGKWTRIGQLAADGELLLVEHEGTLEAVGSTPPVSWKLEGHAIAMTAAAGHVFYATREGPLWQLDRASGRKRDLGLGGWWGTLALAADSTHLYAVTQSGKIWTIDFAKSEKSALAMDGWQNAVALIR